MPRKAHASPGALGTVGHPRVPPAPPPSTLTARRVMLGNRSESAIERELRSELHRRGLRFRKHASVIAGLRCRPDIVFAKQQIAVFVDGCFWHRCPFHGSEPKANANYWRPKLDANVVRDRRHDQALTAAGWIAMRFWAHESISEMADAVQRAVVSELAAAEAGPRPDRRMSC